MVTQQAAAAQEAPRFSRGYGLAFGHAERRAMSMALVERALAEAEAQGEATAPAQDQEFVLMHADNIQAAGFVEHLKLPHHVDFQAELDQLRRLRAAMPESGREEPGEVVPADRAGSRDPADASWDDPA
jgi:alpha-D-ribose 1-methylphosphonate 5-triphosphate synthase subunit PhnI